MSAVVNKILVSNSTGLSLNDRFTAIAGKPKPRQRRRSRSTSVVQSFAAPQKSANRRLLQELGRKAKMQAALKLKRRSMRPKGGSIMKRGTIKALRVAPSGKPIKANSLAKFATMNADFVSTNNYNTSRRPLRRSNSMSSLAGRLGTTQRPSVGGAAQRIANRNREFSRGRGRVAVRGRQSRSRSRQRMPVQTLNLRSVSRGRNGNAPPVNARRGRSRSRSRAVQNTGGNVPVQARLGVRPVRNFSPGNGRFRGRNTRAVSAASRGVANGRIQKRKNSTVQRGNFKKRGNVAGGLLSGRARGRSATRVETVQTRQGRSRSRSRKGSVGGQQFQNRNRSGGVERGRRRGRSQQRSGQSVAAQNNGKITSGQQLQQQRRGRSRSRGGRGGGRGVARNNNGRNLGKNAQPVVKKEALDKELDQYMATTRTTNDMDYLLKD